MTPASVAAGFESLLREFGAAATDLAAGAVKDRLGLPTASALAGGDDFTSVVAAAARAAGGSAERLDRGVFVLTMPAPCGRPVGVLVHDAGAAVTLAAPGVFSCRPHAAPDGLAEYLLGRSTLVPFGGWARHRHGGLDHFYPKAALPRDGLDSGVLARAALGLAAEAAGLLAELGGG